MTSKLLVPLIVIPTKINTKNDTLIDNIFSNQLNSETVCGNLSVNFSDGHLPSFAIFPKPNHSHMPKKQNIFVREKFGLDPEKRDKFMMDLASIDMNEEVLIDNNPENSMNNLLDKTNKLIDKYYPSRKLTKKEFKQTVKPWITKGIITSIKRKDDLFHSYINCKNTVRKQTIHNEYKALKNRITSLIHFSKKEHYSKYFNEYSNNIKKVWKGIKGIKHKHKNKRS